jgi:hypothetical protein
LIDRVERVCIALNYRGPFLANPINLLRVFFFFRFFCLSGFVCWFVYILCSAFIFFYLILLGDGILFSVEHSTYINLLPFSIGPDIVVYQEYFLHFLNFVFVLFCFVFVCFLFIVLLFFVHSNLYRTFIVFNFTLAWRTNILKVTKHSQHYISITWQTFWKGRSIHNITLVLRDKHSENDVAFTTLH